METSQEAIERGIEVEYIKNDAKPYTPNMGTETELVRIFKHL